MSALGACPAHGKDQFWGDGGADVWSSRWASRSAEHLGSARDEVGSAALKAAAAARLAAGQPECDLGAAARAGSEPLPITSSKTANLQAHLLLR